MLDNNRSEPCSICGKWKVAAQMVRTIHGKYTSYMCRDCINYLTNVYKGGQTHAEKEHRKQSF